MKYICSKQGKIDKLWGVFFQHLLQMRNAGIKVEYVRKGEVVLNGKRYEPVYFENTMRYEPIGWKYKKKYIALTGHNIQPLIDYLIQFNHQEVKGKALEDMIVYCFGEYTCENYEKVICMVKSLAHMGIITEGEASVINDRIDRIDSQIE